MLAQEECQCYRLQQRLFVELNIISKIQKNVHELSMPQECNVDGRTAGKALQRIAFFGSQCSKYCPISEISPPLENLSSINGRIKLQTLSMRHQKTHISKHRVYCLLRECTQWQDIVRCRQIQSMMVDNGLDAAILSNYLIRLFASFGNLNEANQAFARISKPSEHTWSGIIAAHSKLGQSETALHLYARMLLSGVISDRYVYGAVLEACTMTSDLKEGRCIHKQIIESGFQNDLFVGTRLVDMYAKCGGLEEAREVFDSLFRRDVVLWGTMIAGYTQHGEGLFALECFKNMQQEGIKPNHVTLSSILKACAGIGAIAQGRRIHKEIIEMSLPFDVILGNTLVDMYAKCGDLEEACIILENLQNPDIVSWSAVISGYAQSGNISMVGRCFQNMERAGIKPDKQLFSTILAACSREGLVGEGCKYFSYMVEVHGIVPGTCHYNCMVDLLGRAGHLDKAEELLQTKKLDIIGCTCLLAACRTYGNVELGMRYFDQIMLLDPHDAGAYVLMSGIYSDAGMERNAAEIEELRQCAGSWKKPAKAWIEVNNEVHEFIVGDKSHLQNEKIHTMLKFLTKKMKEEGYTPKLNLVFQQVSNENKEAILCGHCEKLAIAFGLVSTPPGTTIRVTKNLRVCIDCHNASKVISKLEKREIIIRDSCRTHIFYNGSCSCGDYC